MSQDHTFTGKRGDTVINLGEQSAGAHTIRYRDVYEAVLIGLNRAAGRADDAPMYGEAGIDLSEIDPGAAAQNVCCVLEQRAGIFPNINQANQDVKIGAGETRDYDLPDRCIGKIMLHSGEGGWMRVTCSIIGRGWTRLEAQIDPKRMGELVDLHAATCPNRLAGATAVRG